MNTADIRTRYRAICDYHLRRFLRFKMRRPLPGETMRDLNRSAAIYNEFQRKLLAMDGLA